MNEIVMSNKHMKVIVPEAPLATGSLRIVPISDEIKTFSKWGDQEHLDSYQLIQKITKVWETMGIDDYLVYEKTFSDSTFGWEIIPYQKKGFKFWKQFKVLWKIIFGPTPIPQIERNRIATDFKAEIDKFNNEEIKLVNSIKHVALKNDAFCKPDILSNQLVFEGKEINILYDYAPLEKLHFLLIPKNHCERLTALTEEQFLEIGQLSQKLIKHYGPADSENVYMFSKTGIQAGQTVSHFHHQLVLPKTNVRAFFAKLKVLKNMLFYRSPLSKSGLQQRVAYIKIEMQQFLI